MFVLTRINIAAAAVAIIAVISSLSSEAFAFTTFHQSQAASRVVSSTSLYSSNNDEQQVSLSRRSILSKILTTTAAALTTSSTLLPTQSAHATPSSTTTAALLTDLQTSLTKITQLPTELQNANWDTARTILKTPPVNQLWNLGESSNTIVKLAKETGEMELLELKDDLAISLQMCDQYSYDNVFIYYQPGEFAVDTCIVSYTHQVVISKLTHVMCSPIC